MTDIKIIQRYEESLKNYNKANLYLEKGEYEEFKKCIKKSLALFPREVLLDNSYNIEKEVKNNFEGLFNSIKEKIKEIDNIKNGIIKKSEPENQEKGIDTITKVNKELIEAHKSFEERETKFVEESKLKIEGQQVSALNGASVKDRKIASSISETSQVGKIKSLPENEVNNKEEIKILKEKDAIEENQEITNDKANWQKEANRSKKTVYFRFKLPAIQLLKVKDFFKLDIKKLRGVFILLLTSAIIVFSSYWIAIMIIDSILPIYNIDRHFNLAIKSLKENDTNKALLHFKKVISYSQNNKDLIDNIENLLLAKASFMEKQGKFKESRKIYANLMDYKKSGKILKQYVNNYLKEAEESIKKNNLAVTDFILSNAEAFLTDEEFDKDLIPAYLIKIDTLKYKLYKKLLYADRKNFPNPQLKEKIRNLKYITLNDKKEIETLLNKKINTLP